MSLLLFDNIKNFSKAFFGPFANSFRKFFLSVFCNLHFGFPMISLSQTSLSTITKPSCFVQKFKNFKYLIFLDLVQIPNFILQLCCPYPYHWCDFVQAIESYLFSEVPNLWNYKSQIEVTCNPESDRSSTRFVLLWELVCISLFLLLYS